MLRGTRAVRWALAALGLAVAVGSAGSALTLVRSLRAEVEAGAEMEALTPGLADRIRRSESPVRARLHLARALVAASFEEQEASEGPGGSEPARERLEAAAELARSVLAAHPASWEAAALAGAATYLGWSTVRDPRLLQEYRRWEQPLLYAWELAPDHRYPARYLAAAYLELWPALSPEKQAFAREVVKTAFTDRATLGQLLGPWLEVAGGDAALAPVPDRAWAWAALRKVSGDRGDWSTYCEAWDHERRALVREVGARLAEAEDLAGSGALGRARRELLAIVTEAPVERSFAPAVERALQILPYGPGPGRPSTPAERWLAWALDQELTGGGHALSVGSLTRLRSLAYPDGPASPSAEALAAWVELARGRPAKAGAIRGSGELGWQPEWAPYHLIEARFHLERGRLEDARQALQRVHPDWWHHPLFLRLTERAARRPPQPAAPGSATGAITGGLGWRPVGNGARLIFEATTAAAGLRVTLGRVPGQGAALVLRLDGAALGCRAVGPATGRLEVAEEVEPGIHRLDLEVLAGGRVDPGSAELLPPSRPPQPG